MLTELAESWRPSAHLPCDTEHRIFLCADCNTRPSPGLGKQHRRDHRAEPAAVAGSGSVLGYISVWWLQLKGWMNCWTRVAGDVCFWSTSGGEGKSTAPAEMKRWLYWSPWCLQGPAEVWWWCVWERLGFGRGRVEIQLYSGAPQGWRG